VQTTKKKPSLLFVLLGAALFGYVGYLLNGAWKKGMDINGFIMAITKVSEHPLDNYWKESSGKAILIALACYAIVIIMYYTSQRNLMPGKEFGTARFANVKQVNKILADKEVSFNRILSQNVKMSLNTRKTKLNNNVLIIGGSGAGKTFYEVKPNLMQMPNNCSYVVTDPKGGARRSRLKRVSTARLNCFN
jgi:type IV secretion system protein VirD4